MTRGKTSHRPAAAAPLHEIELLNSIRKIIRGYDVHSRRLMSSSNVTIAQLLCLRSLAELGPRNAKQLAASIHISASTMVGILDRLEAKGLIERRRDPTDRRRVVVTATKKGRAVVRQSPPPLGEELERHFARLSAARQASLSAALRLVGDLVEPTTDR